MLFSYDRVEGGGKNFERAALKVQDLAIDHQIHRSIQLEFNSLGPGARGKRMLDVFTCKQAREILQQIEPPYRGPADILD